MLKKYLERIAPGDLLDERRRATSSISFDVDITDCLMDLIRIKRRALPGALGLLVITILIVFFSKKGCLRPGSRRGAVRSVVVTVDNPRGHNTIGARPFCFLLLLTLHVNILVFAI